MISAYLLISIFLSGWFCGCLWSSNEKFTPWEFVAILALCVFWPYLAFVLFKMWRDGKI